MHFGHTLASACSSFAATNIDGIFVLVTFFVEASTSDSLTPLKIIIGQYLGFSAIIVISLIGYGAAYLIDPEPIGFLGLLPISMGIWKTLGLIFVDEESGPAKLGTATTVKMILKVASVTLMNGGDNVGTYIPLFSQAKGNEIAVYVVTYYILLGIWILAAWLIMKERHILRIAQRYARRVVPFLYIGLGVFIIVNSGCYPWSIKEIDDDISTDTIKNPGEIIMSVMTTFVLLVVFSVMLWKRLKDASTHSRLLRQNTTAAAEEGQSTDLQADSSSLGRLPSAG